MATLQTDTLGICGCSDYHYSDCPTRSTYTRDEFDNEYPGILSHKWDDPEPISYDECEHGNGKYISAVAGFYCEDCDSTFIGPLFIYGSDDWGTEWMSFFL